ncbi:hypothetical protein NM688_g4520 [Phlebia brevispora]|uniref:Uncharacterized protein n=1 Tax=Phlebia brevispora TaxID=194682 RepID=A0ACC1T3A9_9APHY|nr:hypothetical protein NM688_g4520 [Phlebia brevispora]
MYTSLLIWDHIPNVADKAVVHLEPSSHGLEIPRHQSIAIELDGSGHEPYTTPSGRHLTYLSLATRQETMNKSLNTASSNSPTPSRSPAELASSTPSPRTARARLTVPTLSGLLPIPGYPLFHSASTALRAPLAATTSLSL